MDDPIDLLLDGLSNMIDGINRALHQKGIAFWGGCLGLVSLVGAVLLMIALYW